MALLKSYWLLSKSAKEETVCSFQEIFLAHCGFKPRIAASLSWSYSATSVQAKHRRTSQRLRLVMQVPKMKWKLNPKGVHVRSGSKR